MNVELSQGALTLLDGDVALVALVPEVSFRRGAGSSHWRAELQGSAEVMEASSVAHGLAVRLECEPCQAGVVVRATFRNQSGATLYLDRFTVLGSAQPAACRIGANASQWSVFRQGYQSWTGTRSFRSRDVDLDPYPGLLSIGLIDLHNPSPAKAGDFRSDHFAAITNLASNDAVVIGFLAGDLAFGGVEVKVERDRCAKLAASLDYDGVELPPGAEIVAPPLWISSGGNVHQLIKAYADAVGATMRARIPPRNPIGWCSWYYYFTQITEARIVENLEALKRLRSRFAWDYVQVDDGYQAEIGDWLTPNVKFPRGMGWLAEQIRAAGFDAGIWTAPFIARRRSQLMTLHPDWFVKDDDGKPRFALWNPVWGLIGNCYALDTTHPEVLDWLRATFRTIVSEWGYRVLKLDFLFAAALPGQRYDRSATRAQALRRGLDAIREGAGEQAFLLGCGCPQAPAIGVVDAMRIGPDVAPWWSNAMARGPQRDLHGLATKNAIRNTLTRAFSHRRWWLNDPDCLMVRDTKTRLTAAEVRSLATAIAVTDGMIIISDRVEQLSASRLELLDKTLQLAGGKPEIVDLMQADVPELVVTRSGAAAIVAVFNFADVPERRTVDIAKLGLGSVDRFSEMWTGQVVPVVDGQIDLGILPPHDCRVLRPITVVD